MALADGKSTIEVSGIALEMDVRGNGKPLLFLHPEIGMERAGPALDALAKGAKVIAPTHPAYGKPAVPLSFNTIDDIAYLYLDLLEAHDLRDVTIVGLGIGGWIAAEIAVKSAQRLAKMVLVDPFGVKHGDREARDIYDMWFVTEADLQKMLYLNQDFAARDVSKLSDDELYGIARAREASSRFGWRPYMHNPKLKGRLHRIKIPTLVLWGAEDKIVAPAYGKAYAAALPNASFATIDKSGHFPHVEQPQEFARRTLDFIEGKSAYEVFHFTEQPYSPAWVDHGGALRITVPNSRIDPKLAADLLHRYYDEWQLADELGLDIMCNEHHSTATCMASTVVVTLSVLARITKKARLLVLGYPLAHRLDPLRAAEELSTIDVISRGRLNMGFVKGVPSEFAPSNANPVHVEERFWESLDFIIKAMTTHDGPFNWESENFQYRQVNVWPRPYQQPHPPVWSTTGSKHNAQRLGERGYTMATLGTGYATKPLYDSYRDAYRAKFHREPPPDRFGYLGLVAVGETEAEGRRRGELVADYLRTLPFTPAPFRNPPGYISVDANVQLMKSAGRPPNRSFTKDGRAINMMTGSVQDLIDAGIMFCGTPDQVYDQITGFAESCGGMGNLLSMTHAGFMGHDDTVANLSLFAKEVLPRLKEYRQPNEAAAAAE